MADRRADFRAAFGAASSAALDSSENDAGQVVRIRSQDGLSLAVRIFDVPSSGRLPLLCLPGLSRNSRDFLALGRTLPDVAAGERLAVLGAGAYGFVMASNYNSRPRPAEVVVDGERWWVARARETVEELFATERLSP